MGAIGEPKRIIEIPKPAEQPTPAVEPVKTPEKVPA
jgi:hypothetical protein